MFFSSQNNPTPWDCPPPLFRRCGATLEIRHQWQIQRLRPWPHLTVLEPRRWRRLPWRRVEQGPMDVFRFGRADLWEKSLANCAALEAAPDVQRQVMRVVSSEPVDTAAIAALRWFEGSMPADLVRELAPLDKVQWAVAKLASPSNWQALVSLLADKHHALVAALTPPEFVMPGAPILEASGASKLVADPALLAHSLDLPTSGDFLRLLQRVDRSDCDRDTAKHAATVFSSESAAIRAWARSAKRLTHATLEIAAHPEAVAIVTPALLNDMLARPPRHSLMARLEAGILARQWRALRPNTPFPKLRSQLELKCLRLRLEEQAPAETAITGARHRQLTLAPPPILANDWASPLVSLVDIVSEGQLQRNCLAWSSHYLDQLLDGRVSVWRILAPQRASLVLRHEPGKPVTIEELRLRSNAAASAETRTRIEQWLAGVDPASETAVAKISSPVGCGSNDELASTPTGAPYPDRAPLAVDQL